MRPCSSVRAGRAVLRARVSSALAEEDESVAIAVSGSLVLDGEDLVIQAALDGAGLALVADNRATPLS